MTGPRYQLRAVRPIGRLGLELGDVLAVVQLREGATLADLDECRRFAELEVHELPDLELEQLPADDQAAAELVELAGDDELEGDEE